MQVLQSNPCVQRASARHPVAALQEPSSSPAPLSGESKSDMQLPREVIQQLRDVVFGFDTFYVTSVENYQANGVLFKGNLRGRSPAEAYARTAKRFQVTPTCATMHSAEHAYREPALLMSGQFHCWILHPTPCTVCQQTCVLTPEVHASCVLLWCIKHWCICLLPPSKAAHLKHAVVTHVWKAQFARQLMFYSSSFTVPGSILSYSGKSVKSQICLLCSLWCVVHRTDCYGG